jgi:hypothetical protein
MRLSCIAAAACLALLTACGGSSAAPASLDVPLSGLESKAGLTACTTTAQPLTRSVATCSLGTASVTLGSFDSDSHRDLWVLASSASLGGSTVLGHGWAAVTVDPADAAALATALGGTLK